MAQAETTHTTSRRSLFAAIALAPAAVMAREPTHPPAPRTVSLPILPPGYLYVKVRADVWRGFVESARMLGARL